jgi:hypothetical protein
VLTEFHSCPYLAPQPGSPDCSLRTTRARVFSGARGPRPKVRVQGSCISSYRPHRRPCLLLLLCTFHRRPPILDAQVRFPRLLGISSQVPYDVALFSASYLSSDRKVTTGDGSLRLSRGRRKRSRATRPRPAVSSKRKAGKGQGSGQPGVGLERDNWCCYRSTMART